MAVSSAQDIIRFTPPGYDGKEDAPVYLLAPLTWRERGRFRAALASEGIRYPQDGEIATAVLKVIEEVAPANADDLTATVHALQDLLSGERPPDQPGEDASEDDKAAYTAEMGRRMAVAMAYDTVLDSVRQHPRVGSLIGLRVLYNELAPPLAASYALRGWEGIPEPFKRVGGVVPDDLLAAIPDLTAVGTRAIILMSVSAAQRGN